MFTPFQNEPYVNFAEDGPRQKMLDALARVQKELGRTYPIVIGGQRIVTEQMRASHNPACWRQIVGYTYDAPAELADEAVQAATEAFRTWSRVPPEVRARYLVKAAAILRRRIYEFCAYLVYEASKNWNEAYADAAEAIDFLEFYAREAVRWGQPHPTTPYPGEENEVRYIPLGVGVSISPWNFPLAIATGMAAAAIVTGNTVIMKPAEQTPVLAAKIYELFEATSLPPGVLNYLPGAGEVIGEALTGHPGVRFVSFTGSRDVGLHIYQRIATHQPGQKWLKRAILEMGGKDAIIVDEDVNLDGAAEGVVASAFGFQGQKCSACSRLIAHTKIYDALLEKVVERASRLTVGDPANPANYMGAVIDEEAYNRILQYIAIGRAEGRVVLGGEETEHPGEGYFIHPTIIADVDPDARIAQEEIFGPVLAVIRANDFDHALAIANNTCYGLTGGVYSYNRMHLERARHEFHVGNLYFNRKITGALVDVQPFGGFNLSGTDSKAGGRDYLGLFLQAKSISERW
ncbi:MAG: L-glutamate gamma-semialdehyde dehydrogenase [Chloroherpetonaceae bacterium]|nr:L-glutamate gamma-semialdehyde dehydrogenase [Chthonomonadaceae bacterium]MDW8208458.1 L-glutamate gamma-semialdehyde dehydrogenase [Chloroherpetonaceae bacterium]